MPIPAGYTQLTTGFWRKDSDLSGPYAWTGAAFYLISTGVAGSGVPADYTQHPSGFWFKTADGSGPYSYDGTDFWLAGNGGPSGAITVATVNVSSAINMANGSTFDLYNTADQTTNYERLRADWSGDVARLFTQAGGTGVVRGIAVAGGTYGGSSGTVTPFTVNSTFNQSGTAGYILADFNATESATGSGTKLLQRWAVGGTEKARLYNNGAFVSAGVYTTSQLGFTTSVSGGADVELNRDAANTLAQRRSTNAQTFRVYNTYTDGSNNRRWDLSWNTTTAIMRVAGVGTSGDGNLAVGNAALATNATVGYFMIPSSAGAPTGVPADIPTGQVALHFDSTNNKLYVYAGGWLSTAALT